MNSYFKFTLVSVLKGDSVKSDKDCQTIVFMQPKTKQGLIIFTNVDDGYKVYEKILKHYLGDYGSKIVEIEAK